MSGGGSSVDRIWGRSVAVAEAADASTLTVRERQKFLKPAVDATNCARRRLRRYDLCRGTKAGSRSHDLDVITRGVRKTGSGRRQQSCCLARRLYSEPKSRARAACLAGGRCGLRDAVRSSDRVAVRLRGSRWRPAALH